MLKLYSVRVIKCKKNCIVPCSATNMNVVFIKKKCNDELTV